jgi:hypothetical protein
LVCVALAPAFADAADPDSVAVPILRGSISTVPAARKQGGPLSLLPENRSVLEAMGSATRSTSEVPIWQSKRSNYKEDRDDDDEEDDQKTKGENDKDDEDNEESNKHVNVEFYTEFTSQRGYYATAKSLIAPFTDLDSSGFRLALAVANGGGRHHNGETGELNSFTFTAADFMFGYAVEREKMSMKFMIGAAVRDYVLSQPDPTNPVQGVALGVKFAWEMYTDAIKYNMVYADVSYSTAFKSYYAQVKYGYDFTFGKELYFGPEITVLGDENYNEWRLGIHLTEFKVGKTNIGLAAGALYNSDLKAGAYGSIYVNVKF